MEPTDLAVGCPIRGREWIIEPWLNAVKTAIEGLGRVRFVFAADPNDLVLKQIIDWCNSEGFDVALTLEPEGLQPERAWNELPRLDHMVALRNRLLTEVRTFQPSAFLSLDSDILIHPDALRNMYDALDQHPDWGAVGGRCYMHPSGTTAVSWALMAHGGGLYRVDAEGTFPVEVIMAMKLMRPPAYNVDYRLHSMGEDIGWSLACREAGVRLGWDGRVISKHCMTPGELEKVDARVGY